MMNTFISHLFSSGGRAAGSHMLRYQGLEVANYIFALKCLAYRSLRLVQNSGLRLKLIP